MKRPDQASSQVPQSHEQDWIQAIKEGRKAGSDFSESGPLTEFVLLGNIAKKMQSKLYWDAENMKITNDPQANHFLAQPCRPGWTLS